MKVYVTGVIFFNGCNDAEMGAFAPDGRAGMPEQGIPPHEASLWIAEENVADAAWWPGRAGCDNLVGFEGGAMREFRIMDPARIVFPDLNNAKTCEPLDEKLPKLKKKKKNGTTEDFEVDPENAETIARVTIRGGDIKACRFDKKIGVVEWTIPNPSDLQITAILQDGSVAGTITLNDPAAEIIFANAHDLLTDPNRKTDFLADDHVGLFQKLNPEADVTVFSEHAKSKAESLHTENRLATHMLRIRFNCGETPPCCRN